MQNINFILSALHNFELETSVSLIQMLDNFIVYKPLTLYVC